VFALTLNKAKNGIGKTSFFRAKLMRGVNERGENPGMAKRNSKKKTGRGRG